MVGIVLHLPEQYYGDFFSNAGFGSVSFGVEVTEAEFISVQSYLEQINAGYDLKKGFE